ncbi:acyltransferase family protein [Sphingomonas melonis]|nr:acyltransferase family protein [Sphingomonas melonis]AOW24654.1 hypothetical protein BJP26_14625 [Sphingomonas melonis TY]
MSADPAFQTLDPPIWSLVHEMRISLIFPVLAFLVLKRPALAAAAASALFVLGYLPALSSTLSPYPLIFNLARTAPFLIYFVAGILAAIHLDRIATWLDRVGPRGRVALWLFAAALLTFPGGPRIQPVNFLAYGLGGTLLVCLVINSARARAVLGRPVLRWLGRISYSLYLVHCIVLVVLVRVLIGIVPPWLAVAAVPAVSLAAATLMCSWIEAPSQHAGRFISAVWSQRRARRRGQPTTAV